jgi:hypothetical protein
MASSGRAWFGFAHDVTFGMRCPTPKSLPAKLSPRPPKGCRLSLLGLSRPGVAARCSHGPSPNQRGHVNTAGVRVDAEDVQDRICQHSNDRSSGSLGSGSNEPRAQTTAAASTGVGRIASHAGTSVVTKGNSQCPVMSSPTALNDRGSCWSHSASPKRDRHPSP